MTFVRVALSVIELTHVGSCEYQTRVCPRISLLFVVAQLTK